MFRDTSAPGCHTCDLKQIKPWILITGLRQPVPSCSHSQRVTLRICSTGSSSCPEPWQAYGIRDLLGSPAMHQDMEGERGLHCPGADMPLPNTGWFHFKKPLVQSEVLKTLCAGCPSNPQLTIPRCHKGSFCSTALLPKQVRNYVIVLPALFPPYLFSFRLSLGQPAAHQSTYWLVQILDLAHLAFSALGVTLLFPPAQPQLTVYEYSHPNQRRALA